MLDLPVPKVKSSVEAVVDTVVREEKVISVVDVADSVVIERKILEVVAAVLEAAIIPDLTILIPLREVVKKEEAMAHAKAEVALQTQISDHSCV